MSKTIKHKERILEERKRRRESKFMDHMERCPYEDCNAFNGPNATHCHSCGRRLYGIQKTAGVS